MKLTSTLALAALSLSLTIKSQNASTENAPTLKPACGTEAPPPEWDAWFNKKVQEFKDNRIASKTQNTSLTIPVIVHVIHGGKAVNVFPNISGNQIRSQINVFNKDFAGIGFNAGKLAQTGFSVVGAADAHINFCLAQFDPNGVPLAEPGIDRVDFITKGWTSPATPTSNVDFKTLMDGTIKPGTIWDPTLYFNIWISEINQMTNDLLGYATFPAGASLPGLSSNVGDALTDGIWVFARAFGNVGTPSTLSPPYNLGRTATHEVGHWLGLRHVGGDGNGNPSGDCSATDYCNDTPPQKGGNQTGQYGQNFGSPSYPLHPFVCGSADGDMFMNFMDYTEDAFKYMFTPDQVIRMQTAMAEGFYRNNLNVSAATLCAGMPLADFSHDTLGCIQSGVSPFNDTFEGSGSVTYSWSVKPADGVVFSPTATAVSPTITFPSVGVYTITMVATNSLGLSSHTLGVWVEDCTDLNEEASFSGSSVKLIPNPSNGQVIVSADPGRTGKIAVLVYNSLGQLVLTKHNETQGKANFAVDLSAFPDGVYTININNGAGQAVKKLILQK